MKSSHARQEPVTIDYLSKPPAGMSEADMEKHVSWRRHTRKYKKKKSLVKNIWLASGLVMLALPLQLLIALLLFTTFLSFTILDETP